jgi:peptidoglycan/LPS O-acetylase OafA/YrhL
MQTSYSPSRIFGLDVLRAFAILFVMHSHGYAYSRELLDIKYYKWFVFDGVGIFFVLSGYLVGRIFLQSLTGSEGVWNPLIRFWTRRWLRTLPAYFVVLILVSGAYAVSHHVLPPALIQYFTFTQNFAWPHPLFFGEAWSLSVEEWFYLLIPFMMFTAAAVTDRQPRTLFAMIATLVVAVTGFRLFRVYSLDISEAFDVQQTGKQVLTRLDSILYGVLAAWISLYKPSLWNTRPKLLFAAGLAMLICTNAFRTPAFMMYYYFSLSAIGVMLMLPYLSTVRQGEGFVAKSVTFVSVVSYSMYLTNHMIVQRGMIEGLKRFFHLSVEGPLWGLVALVVFWTATLLCAWLLYRFVEQPGMAIRERIAGVSPSAAARADRP